MTRNLIHIMNIFSCFVMHMNLFFLQVVVFVCWFVSYLCRHHTGNITVIMHTLPRIEPLSITAVQQPFLP